MILKKALKFLTKTPPDKLADDLDFSFSNSTSSRRLLIFTENVNATYYLSFHYVLQRLYQQDLVNFFVVSGNSLEKSDNNIESAAVALLKRLQPTLVIFTRYGLPCGKFLLEECRSRRIPTIYHIDDNLLEIPPSLGAGIQKQHGNAAVIQEREYLLSNVDLIYASTKYLAEVLSQRFPNQKIYAGIYAPYLESFISRPQSADFKAKKPFKFGYMGSKGHGQDLESIASAIAAILHSHPQSTFETFGTIVLPESLKDFGDRIVSHRVNVNYEQFLQTLHALNWDLGLAPLEDNKFNKCKAPTKYIEYTACGIPTIASNILVYDLFVDEEEIILADSDNWEQKISAFIDNPQLKSLLLNNAKQRCNRDFNLEVLERQIETVISMSIKS